jgi:hypothetical protein
MSDGPHKSLGMRPGWKKFAKRGDKAAYDCDQVAEALPDALIDDWRAERCSELIDRIKAVLKDGQRHLFDQNDDGRLEALRGVSGVGYPLRMMLLDNIEQCIERGLATPDAILEGSKNTLQDRALRGIREVEEHWQRESTDRRAAKVRQRLEEGTAQTSMDALARRLLKIDPPSSSSPPTRDGLEDGPRL